MRDEYPHVSPDRNSFRPRVCFATGIFCPQNRRLFAGNTRHAARITSLRVGVGATVSKLTKTVTVLNDAGEVDLLTGGPGTDWYFRAADDVITDLLNGVEPIDLI